MSYPFDEITPRRNTNSVKWDLAENEHILPMWVADMDFKTAPSIIEALQRRVEHGVFGYTLTTQPFFDAIIHWWKRKHGFVIQPNWIIPISGVLPALSTIIRVFSNANDQVLLLTPVYDHFFSGIEGCKRTVLASGLVHKNGRYTIDFDDLESKAALPATKLLLLSNPHNPTGTVWTKVELTKIGDICLRHNVLVVSDEIHGDIVHQGFTHIPYASLGTEYAMNSFTCSSPSKSFNLAGVQVAYIFTPNEEYRQKLEALLNEQDTVLLNTFASTALIAAYNDSEEWLEALKLYIYENYQFLKTFISEHLPQIKVAPLEATYLVWMDTSTLGMDCEELALALREKAGLWLNAGTMYGLESKGFLRMNIGCPRSMLTDGLERLKGFVDGMES